MKDGSWLVGSYFYRETGFISFSQKEPNKRVPEDGGTQVAGSDLALIPLKAPILLAEERNKSRYFTNLEPDRSWSRIFRNRPKHKTFDKVTLGIVHFK